MQTIAVREEDGEGFVGLVVNPREDGKAFAAAHRSRLLNLCTELYEKTSGGPGEAKARGRNPFSLLKVSDEDGEGFCWRAGRPEGEEAATAAAATAVQILDFWHQHVTEQVIVHQQMMASGGHSIRHRVFYFDYDEATGTFPARYAELGAFNSIDRALALLEKTHQNKKKEGLRRQAREEAEGATRN
jgi:hypothetical protein